MSRRALDFATAHPISDSGFAVVLKRLTDAVARATELGLQETGGRTGEVSGVSQRRALRRRIRREYLMRVVRLAEQAEKTHPELMGVFFLPTNRAPTKEFLLAARTLQQEAATYAAVLSPLGLTDNFASDLGALLDQFEGTGTAIDTGRAGHVGAAGGFASALDLCRSLVDVIDTFYQGAFADNAEILSAWKSARSVEGPFRHKADAAPVPDSPAPAPQPTPNSQVA